MSVYEVTPVNRNGDRVGRSVYLRGLSAESVLESGKRYLRILGQRGRFYVKAKSYNPLNDPEMREWVRRVQ